MTITCHVKELFLGRSLQVSVPLLVTGRQLSHLLFQPLELLKFLETVHLPDLVVERQVLDRRIDCLARLSTNPDALQTSLVDFLSQLIAGQQVRSIVTQSVKLQSTFSLQRAPSSRCPRAVLDGRLTAAKYQSEWYLFGTPGNIGF